MAHLSLGVLGALTVLIDGIPVNSFESDKVRALLVYLAVEAHRSHHRETLIGLLWPDCPEETARHNLRQALFNLRLALGDHTAKPPFLIITRDSIQFNQESDFSLDLAQFSASFNAWEKDRDRERKYASKFVTPLEEMVGLYRGDFLQQFFLEDSAEFEEWKLVHREALRQHVLDALTYLTNEYEQRADYSAARRYAMRQLELDPWREESHCQLMRALALSGQRSAALVQYETCRRVLLEELGVEPSAKTRELYEQIRLGHLKPQAEPAVPLHSLPIPLTPFLGRERELEDLGKLISDPLCRCISLVGPGGMGKTRLALQAAEQHAYEFDQGAAFIPLASVGSIETVIPAVATAIQFAFNGPSDPKVQLFNYLREKQMLLVMDNVEHLLREGLGNATIADLFVELLQQDARVKLLVTSREALNLQEEWLFEVQGLSFPKGEKIDTMDKFSAVALFVQRARRARPGYEMSEEDKMGAVRLCRLVEGMPLAIELAATWVRLLSPSEIAVEIEHSLDFLNAQMRDLPERHRSMRAVFDYSWQALSADEQQVLSKLSVFRGGFQREAAEQVAGASLSILSSLVTRSLLRRTATGRYDLHELVRQYAASKLAEDSNKLQLVLERHSQYYLGLLKERESKLQSQHQKEALAELTAEMDNIRAAWDWSITNQIFIPLYGVFLAFWYVYELHSWFKEGEIIWRNTSEALNLYIREVRPVEVEYLLALNASLADYAYFTFRQGRSLEAYANLATSVAFLRTCPDPSAAIHPLLYLGIVCWELGRFTEAKESLQECLGLSLKYGERWFEASSNEFLGVVAHDQGDYPRARQYLGEALAIYRQIGDPIMTAHLLSYLGRTLSVLGDYSEAEMVLREGLGLTREVGYRFGSGLTLDALGQVASAQGRFDEALALFSESAGLFRDMGDRHRLSRTLNHRGMIFLALNRETEAQNAFITAMRMAKAGGLIPSELNALAGMTALDTRQKPNQDTFELVIFVLQHPASNEEAKDLASQLQEELITKLTSEEIQAAEAHAGSKSLDELVVRVIASAKIIPLED
jgi:predicted ATPase/DNA-binding SARP family transcriptional activator